MSPRPTHPIEHVTQWIGSVPSLIVHTVVFAGAFLVAAIGLAPWDIVLLVITTVVSLEAIYLAIFIQMSVNRAQQSLAGVEADVAGIEENIEDISEDIEGIEKDVAEIEKDVAGIEEDIEEVTEDIEELHEEVGELHEGEEKDATRKHKQEITLGEITTTLQKLLSDIEQLKQR